MSLTRDDEYLWAWKNSGMSDLMIAARLNITPEQVQPRFDAIRQVLETAEENRNGFHTLNAAMNTMALQYQLAGESLKNIASNLQSATVGELLDYMPDHPEQEACVQKILRDFIVLRPLKETQVAEIAAALGKS